MSENGNSDINKLFKGVRFYTMGDLDEKVKEDLVNRKAKSEAYLSAMVTHAIVSDSEHYELDAAQNMWQIPTVTPLWVTMSVMCKTLLPTKGFLPGSDQLFAGVKACFSNIPKSDKTTLWALITFNGGSCQPKLNKEVTHLITPLPTGDKCSVADKHETIKIVSPDWITNSIEQKTLQACDKYNPKLNIVPSPVKVEPSSPIESPKEIVSEPLKKLERLSVGEAFDEKSRDENDTNEITSDAKRDSNLVKQEKREGQLSRQSVLGSASEQPQLAVLTSNQNGTKIQPTAPTETSQKVPMPLSAGNAAAAHMVKHQAPPQFRQATNIAGQRFAMATASAAGVRHSLAAPVHPMMTSGGQQFAMVTSGQQVFLNQSTPTASMMTPEQQRPVLAPNSSYMVVSSTPSRTPASPRRSSSQSSGGKKKKPSRPAMAGHPNMPQGQQHLMAQFQGSPQTMFTPQQQQQMMQKMRMSGASGEQMMVPGQNAMEGSSMVMGPRFGGMPGTQNRFSGPGMMPQHDENAQHLHQQQLFQQQQQMQRMAMMRQAQPANAGVMNQMERMQQKWPRQAMDASGFAVDHQGHQYYPGHGAHQTGSSNEEAQSMHQVVQNQMPQVQSMQMTPTQNAPSHQHYNNSAMVNRFGVPLNPQQQQQQQLIFQQMQQQQHQSSNRFPTSTSLEAAGITGISPFALQQGILNADSQADNPPLIHPSLQGLSPKVATTSQNTAGSSVPKKRSKSRKKTDALDEEGKARQRQRTGKTKQKSPVSTGGFPMLNANMNPMQSPTVMMMPPQPQFNNEGPKIPITRSISAHPDMSPAYGPQFNASAHSISPSSTSTHLSLTGSTPPQMPINEKPPAPMIPQSYTPPNSGSMPQTPSIPTPVKKQPVVPPAEPEPPETIETESSLPSRDFVDPLTFKVKELDSDYITRTPGETVPEILFLLGCVFHITEYDTFVNDVSVISLWKNIIEKYGGIVEEQYNPKCTHLICSTCTTPLCTQAMTEGKRCVTIYWLNDVLRIKTLRIPWLALHFPTIFAHKKKPATNHTLTFTNYHVKERVLIKMMGFVCGATFTGYLSRSHTGLLCKTNEGMKYDKAKSWSIPCVNALWLRDVLHSDGTTPVDMSYEKYQKTLDTAESVNGFLLDISKVQHLLQAWKSPIVVTRDCLMRARVKHQFEPMPPSPSQPKRLKAGPNSQPLPRVCFTGLPLATVLDLTKKLESLDGRSENTFALCTHLVAKNVCRTVKFLSCVSQCSYVVTPEWIEDSFKSNWLLDESKYLLHDKIAEESFNFSLQESIARANASPLFKDCLFCISSGVTPAKETLKQIIECAGGKILNKVPALSVLKHLKARRSPDTRIIVISCPSDEKFFKQLKKEGLQVHSAEIVLTGVLKQELDFESYKL